MNPVLDSTSTGPEQSEAERAEIDYYYQYDIVRARSKVEASSSHSAIPAFSPTGTYGKTQLRYETLFHLGKQKTDTEKTRPYLVILQC